MKWHCGGTGTVILEGLRAFVYEKTSERLRPECSCMCMFMNARGLLCILHMTFRACSMPVVHDVHDLVSEAAFLFVCFAAYSGVQLLNYRSLRMYCVC